MRSSSMRVFCAALAVVAGTLLGGCGYNTLIQQDEQVKAAWSEVVNQYQRQHRAARPPAPRGHGLSGRIEAAIARSPRLKRAVREFSSRYPAVRRLRVLAWQALERARSRGR